MDIRIERDNQDQHEDAELSFQGLKKPQNKSQSKPQNRTAANRLMETPIRRPSAPGAVPARRPAPQVPREHPAQAPQSRQMPLEQAEEIFEEEELSAQKQARERSLRRFGALAAAVFLVGILGFLVYRFLRIETITVEGNKELSAEYITELSGLEKGEHIFTIDMDALKSSFSRDARVEYQDMKYTFPNHIRLTVKECLPIGKFALTDGNYLLVDATGKAVDEKQAVREYVLIEGLELTEYSIGYAIRTSDTYKQSVLAELLTALNEAGYDGEIERLDITSITNIKLYNHTGMEIRFGDAENFDLKIKWTRAVIEKLAERGIKEGIVDVYAEDQAIYSKPETATADGNVTLNYMDLHYEDAPQQEDSKQEVPQQEDPQE